MTTEELNQLDRFARANDIQLTQAGTAQMRVTEQHLNGAGVCQGGALFTLADLAAASATQGQALTTNSEIHFLHSARLGELLTAESRIAEGGRMPLVETEIRNQDNRLLVKILARFYHKQP